MEWHWADLKSIVHHLPHAAGDLLHHEDKDLVRKGAAGLQLHTGTHIVRHKLILPESIVTDHKMDQAPRIAIEKDIDPGVSRSEQNLGLLVRDYLNALPGYSATTDAGQALLEHWRKILMEQPQRLAEAHLDSWNNERSRAFWRERLSHMHTDPEPELHPVDDWERSAGTLVPGPGILAGVKSKQWQDLVIRQRLHQLEIKNTGVKI